MLTTTGSLASTIGKYNPFRYRSYYYDEETGWYYLQSRYYDPTVGRFLNADAIIGANGGIQGYNMFAYCNNNPVLGYDPSGKCCHGDAFFTTPTNLTSFEVGDICWRCGKEIDKVFFKYPYEWTEYAYKFPQFSGREIGLLVLNKMEADADCGTVSVSLTVQVGVVSYQTAIVIDEDEVEVQNSVMLNSSVALSVSVDVTMSTATDVSQMKGYTAYQSKSLKVGAGFGAQYSRGVMPSWHTTYSAGFSFGIGEVGTNYYIGWTW